ncbi:type VII secretion integral membrane protein EccD [Plantactinospora soyae]|uniref:Type VII secretion integral membrane protein EccD n=1 Tax=Plantactinospora soyae TaxID=1544732 RepID=A0A927M2G0_9ACTN|nr:type VII secretion integral membrane protein EccD [Plantactinospora soyae]MBE1485531.1 type VII secretion integral membrane protein EccD [Plantactinospora soyae]
MSAPSAVPPNGAVSGLRRVTVVAPRARMDVGLPVQCTLAELIPQLVQLAGAATQPGPEGAGWALSRIGGPPIPPGLTVAAASLTDGEILQLSARTGYETPPLYDDVVDAIASAARTRRGAWRPRVGRRLGLATASVLFTGTTALVLAGLSGQPQAPVAVGVIAVALLLAGGALARAYGDVAAASACAGAGLVAAGLAGITALAPHEVWPVGSGSLAIGLGALTLYAALTVAVVHRHPWFVSVLVASAAGALVTASVLLFGTSAPNVAAIGVTLLTGATALAPMISLRLARLPLPSVPEDMESFREDERPALGSEVLDATSAAAGLLTALVAALGVAVAGCAAVVLGEGSVWSSILVGLVGVAWLLRSRSYAGAAQRVCMVVVGLVVLAGLGWRLPSVLGPSWLFAVAVVVAAAGALCLVYADRVVRNIHSPFTGRWLDICEYLVLISLIPVAAAMAGVYNAVRDAVG